MRSSNLFVLQTLPKQEVVCRYMQSKRPTIFQIIVLVVSSILCIVSGLIFLSTLPSSMNLTVSLLLGGLGWCILSFVTAQLIIKHSQPKNIQIPLGFRQVIKSKFPKVFFDLVTTQDLDIMRFRELVTSISNFRGYPDSSVKNNLDKLSSQLRNAIEAFSVKDLDREIKNQEILNLDDLFVEHCPLYWMKRFIELGDDEVLNENEIRRSWDHSGAYWFSELGLIHESSDNNLKPQTIFNLHLYGLVQEIDESEYSCLMYHVKNNTWNHQDVAMIVDRLLIVCQGDYSRYISEKDKDKTSTELRVEFTEEDVKSLLLCMCLHGLSWRQLELIRSTPISSWQFLSWIDRSTPKRGMRILAGCFLKDFINESNPNYESGIALSTYSEYRNVTQYRRYRNQKDANALSNICCYFSHRMRFHKKKIEADLHLKNIMNFHRYVVDVRTGIRTRISENI
ncbi:Protein of unknown function (DUF1389) [Chlamydia poikilotherma]|uniref:DUF1389 domain-containing protein n=1 Tax=Chlamydia poikilotherma TaxID=1967783 RepID=A0A3B0Q7K1_9CHLA|nr:DUF1389 domain-containing protein [Chlamydia poikilotherma]SYX08917.1 Protein of unknown function (DUF1389) [Chlamydia poikilotherma]